jgi:ribosomal protein S18 acetylase RimI-like enzyme
MGTEESDSRDLIIRRGSAADHDALAAIDSYAADHPSRISEVDAWLVSAEVLVAERAERVMGYAVVTSGFLGQPYLAMLMVAADVRRQGIGRQLVETHRAGRQLLWSSTNESNRAMQALLGQLGFRLAGRIEGFDKGDPELFYLWNHTT